MGCFVYIVFPKRKQYVDFTDSSALFHVMVRTVHGFLLLDGLLFATVVPENVDCATVSFPDMDVASGCHGCECKVVLALQRVTGFLGRSAMGFLATCKDLKARMASAVRFP